MRVSEYILITTRDHEVLIKRKCQSSENVILVRGKIAIEVVMVIKVTNGLNKIVEEKHFQVSAQ